MANAKSQFIGATGQYYVAYGLSSRWLHATITLGNAMGVDILCANAEGTSSLSIQVKTANNAAKNSYGETGFNWDVGVSAAGKFSPNLWYAFVDLRGNTVEKVPNVYFVPSRWVGMFIEKTWSRKLFYLKTAVASKVENNWDMVKKFLDGDKDIHEWANSLDPDFRWWGSKDEWSSSDLETALHSGQYILDENNCLKRNDSV